MNEIAERCELAHLANTEVGVTASFRNQKAHRPRIPAKEHPHGAEIISKTLFCIDKKSP
jgi:hypothetical protein